MAPQIDPERPTPRPHSLFELDGGAWEPRGGLAAMSIAQLQLSSCKFGGGWSDCDLIRLYLELHPDADPAELKAELAKVAELQAEFSARFERTGADFEDDLAAD